ncbi:MAG TPA: PrsW family intramembrane metalloprotease [Anaerolineales bacterium]|nr:PrsW family intramembrane metalloprotease [Anaerolineales bacterium]
MGLLVSGIIGFGTSLFFAWIVYWLDRYEKEPLLLLAGVFLWGAVIAAGSAFVVNTVMGAGISIFTGSSSASDLATGSLVAPLVEETLKGLAVLGVFLVFRREFDSILDGIIYAAIAALGFAATENTYYIYTYGFQQSGWTGILSISFVRVIIVGWQHPFYTAFTGIGLAVARLNRNWGVKILAPILGLAVAMFTHAIHNTVSTLFTGFGGFLFLTGLDWTGWFFMFIVILWATWREQVYLKKFLASEVQAGIITQEHLRTASSAWLQMFARTAAIFRGKYRDTARFFQVCGEYAHKRQQYATMGDEGGNLSVIQQLRAEMAVLAPRAQV